MAEPTQVARDRMETTPLMVRDLTILQLVASGYTSTQIAQLLATTPKAVDLAIGRAVQHLGASHRTEAVAIAQRRGLII